MGEVAGDWLTLTVHGLTPSRKYLHKMHSHNVKSFGPFSSMESFTTLPAGAFLAHTVLPRVKAEPRPSIVLGGSCSESNKPGIQPPDLWIHHGHLELKNFDKGERSNSPNHASIIQHTEVVESLFTSSLKEAGGLKHRGQVTTTSLQARNHKHLWMGLWNGRLHCGFTKINRTCKTCQALMSSVEEIGIPIMRETHSRTTPSPDASKLLPSCSRHTSRMVVAWGGTVHFLLSSVS
ncbi:uncharacterized protein LOC126992599 [Eriocheir sinensis]|uniref:uncharacterized protein LOC126992599 n=1 Tax=Eriocheir sinensis TaxID=95602 RepID=UPI0021C94462|nr:uncharacterized protein LOC126992599 [Eriocheir sinensis]